MAAMLRPLASMGITGMRRTLAHLTATTGRIGFTAAYLLELDLGSAALETGSSDAVVSADVEALVDAEASVDVAALTDAAASTVDVAALAADEAAGLRADRLVVDSTVVAVGTSAEQAADSTAVEARSTAEVAVDSTAVEEAMAAGTGN